MPASSYVAPDNASIAAIKAKTDGLNFVGTDVKATPRQAVTAATVNDKTGYSLAAEKRRHHWHGEHPGATAQGRSKATSTTLNAAILEGRWRVAFERIKALDDAYTAARAAKLTT